MKDIAVTEGAKFWPGFCRHTKLQVEIWGWCTAAWMGMLAKGGGRCKGSPSRAPFLLLAGGSHFTGEDFMVYFISLSCQGEKPFIANMSSETSKNQR